MRLLLAPLRLTSASPRCLLSSASLHPASVTTTCLPGLLSPLTTSATSHHATPPHRHLLSPLASPSVASLHTSPVSAGLRDLVAPGGAIRNVLGKLGVLNVSRARLRAVGYLLYETAADGPDYVQFFQLCEMPDTFFSWYLVTELHVWMLCVRLADDGAEGKFCRGQLITAMWEDLETRSKKLGSVAASVRNEQIQQTSHHFQAALLGYDEGLQDDRVLASALWRRLFSRGGKDATRLETIVAYVRREQARLDRLSRDRLLLHGQNSWGPLLVT
ncbi:ubiquinol-cytochrome-c reductase complex assembly factor 1-like [Amphibalanus amphitrite]|uniref:ubiquinol-cytochrome-c reductase complex assembly factor 1-like n=1 Tax=Amphibalanus amphitrite TaxID=1232801 RepID=UPI001C903571|nr:ubiquinol-cytochrome-c reductase complex assembly factor 1-like [Amphibalanus amphitrite]